MRNLTITVFTIWIYDILLLAIMETSTDIPAWLRIISYGWVFVVAMCFIYFMSKRKVLVSDAAIEWLRSHTGEYANEIHKYITGTAKK